MLKCTACLFALALLWPAAAFAAETGSAASKQAFEQAFDAGALAIAEDQWILAEQKFGEALKALGEAGHANKALAKMLLEKTHVPARQEELLHNAAEFLRLKQWTDAEVAYRKAAVSLGETSEIKKGIAAAQAGAAGKSTSGEDASGSFTADGAILAIPIPAPAALSPEEWQQGPGSASLWTGNRLSLEEGDEVFIKPLKRDFALAVAIEAEMDDRSLIRIELRPARESGARARIIGWGSKEGSAPLLAIDREIKVTGDKQAKGSQITLAMTRTGTRIEFYCNGSLVGRITDAKPDQPYQLVVGGKGILYAAKIAEKQ